MSLRNKRLGYGVKYGHLRIFLLSSSWNRFPTATIRVVRLKFIIICKHPKVVNSSGGTSLRYLPCWCVQVNILWYPTTSCYFIFIIIITEWK